MRRDSEALAANLSPEDQAIQSMPDASPTKWHLAHTSWFFETFILAPLDPGYRAFDPAFAYLFNSYYEAAGPRHPRPRRGLLSRPTVDAVGAYRDHVTAAMLRLCDQAGEAAVARGGAARRTRHPPRAAASGTDPDGHQARFSVNPLLPAYQAPRRLSPRPPRAPCRTGWVEFAGGLVEIGHAGGGFAFDNEGPRHKVWLDPFRLATASRLCGEYLDFIADGGYRRAEFWLSDGWATVQHQGWQAPLYWLGDRAARRGGSSRSRASARSIPRSRSAMSASTRPTPLPAGPGTPADRGGMGNRRGGTRRSPAISPTAASIHPDPATVPPEGRVRVAPDDRRCLGMDRQPLCRLSEVSRGGRSDRRIQRQVHVEPDGAARRRGGDAAPAICGSPTATFSRRPRAGRFRGCGSRRIYEDG